MAIEIVKTTLQVASHREEIRFMDDFGTESLLYINVSDSANRQAHIDEHLATQIKNQEALEAYALKHGHDLAAEKAAGIKKRAHILGSKK